MPLKLAQGGIFGRVALYLGLALVCLVLMALVVVVIVYTGISVPGRWAALATFTVVLGAATVKSARKYWRSVSFWFIFAGLLSFHLLLFTVILRNVPDFRVIWYVPVVIVEAGIFGAIYDLLLARTSG
jgi:hypothetical protein